MWATQKVRSDGNKVPTATILFSVEFFSENTSVNYRGNNSAFGSIFFESSFPLLRSKVQRPASW